MKFAKIVFYIAGIYGLILLFPLYFMETKSGEYFPPQITHPEYYYGSVGVALAFQILFLIIAGNPVQYRAAMIPSVLEKFSFGIAAAILFLQSRLAFLPFAASLVDLAFGLLFIAAFVKTEPKASN